MGVGQVHWKYIFHASIVAYIILFLDKISLHEYNFDHMCFIVLLSCVCLRYVPTTYIIFCCSIAVLSFYPITWLFQVIYWQDL